MTRAVCPHLDDLWACSAALRRRAAATPVGHILCSRVDVPGRLERIKSCLETVVAECDLAVRHSSGVLQSRIVQIVGPKQWFKTVLNAQLVVPCPGLHSRLVFRSVSHAVIGVIEHVSFCDALEVCVHRPRLVSFDFVEEIVPIAKVLMGEVVEISAAMVLAVIERLVVYNVAHLSVTQLRVVLIQQIVSLMHKLCESVVVVSSFSNLECCKH